MEGDKINFSTFSVPGTMSDLTLLSTPMPQAASTATKRRSVLLDNSLNVRDLEERSGKNQETQYTTNPNKSHISQISNQKNMKRSSSYDKYRNITDSQIELLIELGSDKRYNDDWKFKNVESGSQKLTSLDIYKNLTELGVELMGNQKRNYVDIKKYGNESGDQKLTSWATSGNLKYNTKEVGMEKENVQPYNKDLCTTHFNLCGPPGPCRSNSGSSAGKKFNTELRKGKTQSSSKADVAFKIPSALASSKMSDNFLIRDDVNSASEKLSFSAESNFGKARDLVHLQNERTSMASSANSSLGIISSDVLEEAHHQPLVDVNQDLSLRLAQKLNLDSSLLKNGMDISALAAVRYKERVAAKCEGKNENQRSSGRSSSDYWTIHGYSSDNSDSRNNTAKRLSCLSTGSGGEAEVTSKVPSSPRTSPRPLSEMNYQFSHRESSSKSGRWSAASNPFSGYSNVSVSSDDFNFEEDAMQRLERDERQFSLASTRSLSGVYGDGNMTVNVNGEKLSMSSFLRSGSGPLGCLEPGGSENQRPQFGMLVKSPEKKGTPRAILPPPQEKPTFLVEEEPVRDTPWAPNSLLEQFSNIHTTDINDSDTSVPSLSYISQLLENMHEGANPQDLLAQLMASKNKTKSKPYDWSSDKSFKAKRISSIVEGGNSFCQSNDSERILGVSDKSRDQRSGLETPHDDSATSSISNVTDFEGDEDACVCVMTPESMDFDVVNDLSEPLEYSFSKACYVDGERKDAAAYVHLPASKLVLFPAQRKTLTITIAAMIEGVIKIKIEVSRKNPLTQARECSYVYGKVVAELPKLVLETPHHIEMMPMQECEFGGKYHHTIVIKNNGRSEVPLKLILTKVNHDGVIFHLGEKEKQTTTTMIRPGEVIKQLVVCETPAVFAGLNSPETIIPVEARVNFLLATTDLHRLEPVSPVVLVAPLKPYFFGVPSQLFIPSLLTLHNSCDHPVSFETVIDFGYSIQPSTFNVPPHQTFFLSIDKTDTKNPLRKGELTLHSLIPRGMYTVKLREDRCSSLTSSNSLATPQSSRATSPTSPSSSLRTPVEALKLACSHKKLVWGGCHLHQTVIKVFCLKNVGGQREKLRLTISDQTHCFKIVNEKDKLVSELKLSLQPTENREIKVAVLPTASGPQWGHLTISRISSPVDKNVLPLYAFGGRSKVTLTEGVMEVAQHMFLLLSDTTLQSSFVLSNTGDSSAFFKISEANTKSSVGLTISPQESVLPPGCTAAIHICLSVTAARLEVLLRQTTQSVCVAKLSICFGDESTRQRLMRLMMLRRKSLGAALAARVSVLSSIGAPSIANLDKLDGSSNDAEILWDEDTDMLTVEVFVQRNALEARHLDTSVNFVGLSTTITKQY